MSISYHGIIGNKAKTTMGSAESWYKNKNILRDPPKSITTRRIDKVNGDGSLNAMMYHNGDRIAENINVFARGVNPMVAVEYTNHGSTMRSSGGGAEQGLGAFGNGAPGKLPYRVMNAGAFRPPQLRQEQLLPLSRQPRNVTHVLTNKEFIDYTKSVTCQSGKCPSSYRQIKESFKSHIEPTKTCKIASPVQEHFVMKYVIDNPTTTSASTAKVSKANIQMINRESLREAGKTINQYSQSAGVQAQGGQNYIHEDVTLERNIPTYTAPTTKTSAMKKTLAPDYDMLLERNIPTHIATTNVRGDHTVSLDYENDYVLERNIPEYNAHSNISDKTKFVYERPENDYQFEQKTRPHSVQANLRGQSDVEQNRTYILPESLHAGGFEGKSTLPLTERTMTYNPNYVNGKMDIARKVRESR
jgi:hypothetical protein